LLCGKLDKAQLEYAGSSRFPDGSKREGEFQGSYDDEAVPLEQEVLCREEKLGMLMTQFPFVTPDFT
jgi:hypothetical protein